MSTVRPPLATAEALLADGTTVELRPLGPDDHRAVLDLHAAGMAEESRRMRFFGVSRNAPGRPPPWRRARPGGTLEGRAEPPRLRPPRGAIAA
ncbi:hypothetical protein ACWGKU_07015 [Kitasatospora sp. NPDC054768]